MHEMEARTDCPTVRDLPAEERPRERLQHFGANALSTTELLAIVLQTGSRGENALRLAERLLIDFDGLPGLGHATIEELCQVTGVGMAKASQLKASLELGKRLLMVAPTERFTVQSPADAANLLMPDMALLEQEEMRTILLDSRNRVIRTHTVYAGSLNHVQVRVGEVFREAIRTNSAALIVAHNHPSGLTEPSREDIQVTRQLGAAGRLLGIEVLDHVVLGRQNYCSLRERGLGFEPSDVPLLGTAG